MSATAHFFVLAGGGVAGFGALGYLIKSLIGGIAADIARLVELGDRQDETLIAHGERIARLEAVQLERRPPHPLSR